MQQNRSDADSQSAFAAFYVVAGILIVLLGLYWYFHNEIVRIIFSIKALELKLAVLFNSDYLAVLKWCAVVQTGAVSLSDLKYLALLVGDWYKTYLSLICVFLITSVLIFHPARKFRTCYSMYTLWQKMQHAFKSLYKPKHDQHDLLKGDHAMGLTPFEYVKQYADSAGNVSQIALYNNLISQLGNPWHDFKKLDTQEQILFTAFVAYSADQRNLGNKILAMTNKQVMLHGFKALKHLNRGLDKRMQEAWQYQNHPKVQRCISSHYYVRTLLCQLLATAREGGIVPSVLFLWLKKHNRTLWYALNNVGRRAYFVEAAAITGHWQMEVKTKMKQCTPFIQHVVQALLEEYKLKRGILNNE